MAKNQKSTADQHYVPRFYLRNFSLQVGKPKKRKYLIGFYQFNNQLLKEPVCAIESVCYENFYYGEDGEVEKHLSVKEGAWSSTVKSAIDDACCGKPLSIAEKDNLKEFALYQYACTTSMVNYVNAQSTTMMMSLFLMEHPEYKADENKMAILWKLCEKKIKKMKSPSDYLQIAVSLLETISDLDVSLVRFNTISKLITSDAPIVILNPYTVIHNAGLGTIGIVIVFPINSSVAVLIYDGKMYTKIPDVIEGSEKDVDALNRYQYITAEERILSIHIDVIERLVNDKELNKERDKFRDKEKLSQMPTEPNNPKSPYLMAIHGRCISYMFPLSFIKLPRGIKKISVDCREAVMRKDEDHGWRDKLLILSYGFSEVERQLGMLENIIRERRKDYRRLLDYMNNYWEIPISERTITPQMMATLRQQNGILIRSDVQ